MELAPDVARIAQLIGEPARAAMLVALVDGRARPAGELARLGNVAPQTASFHLRKLIDASLLAVERQGKHSYYRLANHSVASILESLAALAPIRHDVAARERTRFESARVQELRFARLCYTHLAGALAVDLHRALVDRGFPHLGGALGAAVFNVLIARKWIAAIRGERAVRVTLLGVRELEQELGITLPRNDSDGGQPSLHQLRPPCDRRSGTA
jgi:DNA-binding transcriptional ArsR family regulator